MWLILWLNHFILSGNDFGHLSSWWIFSLCSQAVQPAELCSLQWYSSNSDLVQICALKQPQQMWYCKIPITTLNLTWVKHFDVSVFMCVLKKMRESSAPLLTAEITAPAGLRTVLHHGGSWIHDVTFEPQPGPDQMLDFLIKYLSASVNYPTSVWHFDGHYKTGCWPPTEHCPFPHSTLVHLR